jgi:hypothetical protein
MPSDSIDGQRAWVSRVLGFEFAAAGTSSTSRRAEGDGAVVRMAQAMLTWSSTRSYVGQELQKLEAAILAAHRDDEDFDDIEDGVENVEVILDKLDGRLLDKLDELRGSTDAAAKAKISQEARGIVRDYQAYVASDPLMNDIDDNGYLPLDIRSKVQDALNGVLVLI